MSKTQWTAGPWEAYPTIETGHEPPYTPVGANTLLAKVYSEAFGDYDESIANAHLIAAAPDLYEALKASLHFMETADVGPPRYVISITRAALAKARGEEPSR